MGIKGNVFCDQSSNGRLQRIKEQAKNTTNQSYTNGYYIKDTKETTTVQNAITRVRGGGYVVPNKVRNK